MYCVVVCVGICAVCGVYAICRVVNDFNVGSGEKEKKRVVKKKSS